MTPRVCFTSTARSCASISHLHRYDEVTHSAKASTHSSAHYSVAAGRWRSERSESHRSDVSCATWQSPVRLRGVVQGMCTVYCI